MKTLLCILLLSALTLAQMADARKQDHGEHECKESPFPGVLLAPAADQTITGPHYLIFETGLESLKLFPGFLENHSAFAQGTDFYTHADAGFRAPYINFYKSRGTQVAPTALTFTGYELDSMGGLNFGGHDGLSYAVGAALYTNNDEDWTPLTHGGHLSIYATFLGQITQHQVFQFSGKDPQGIYGNNIISYEPLVFFGNQRTYPGLFPVAGNAPLLQVRTGDNLHDAGFSMGSLIVTTPHTPATAFDACVAGTVAWDANFVYVCVATNTWRRSGLAAW